VTVIAARVAALRGIEGVELAQIVERNFRTLFRDVAELSSPR
jgi:Tat protein secretion system quality control protein TatD with DNase activity